LFAVPISLFACLGNWMKACEIQQQILDIVVRQYFRLFAWHGKTSC